MNPQTSNTNVLLLIIPNPNSTILPHSLFYRLFSAYGEVVKILIFEKARVWKAFVEMGSDQQARTAQSNLNGIKVAEGITMNVYFSNLKTVTFLNNNCGGVDYRQLKQKNAEKRKSLSDNHEWMQATSQPDLNYQPNYYQFNTNPFLYHSYQHVPDVMFTKNDLANQPWLVDSKENLDFKASTQQYNLHLYHRMKRNTSLENLVEPSTNQSSANFDRKYGDSQLYIPSMSSSRMMTLQRIKEEEGSPEHNHKASQEEMEGFLNKDEEKKLVGSDLLDDNNHDHDHEGLSPEGQNIMKAFTSDYMFAIPQVGPKGETRKARSSVNLEKEINAQMQALDISDFQGILAPPPNLDPPKGQKNLTEEIVDPSNYVNPQFLIENQPSKVIYIRGLSHPSLSPVNIFNLLSNCGNVMVIIYIKQKSSALVQFEKLQQAQNAKDHFNNMPFFGQKLKIFYSNYQQIQFPLPYQSPQTMIYIPSKDQFRFGEGKSISFNPPSQTLHLSNIKYEVTEDENVIRKLFEGIGTVQAVKFMHLNQQKHMALVKLSSLEEAMNGAALLHGKELYGRKINVSFTKSKF